MKYTNTMLMHMMTVLEEQIKNSKIENAKVYYPHGDDSNLFNEKYRELCLMPDNNFDINDVYFRRIVEIKFDKLNLTLTLFSGCYEQGNNAIIIHDLKKNETSSYVIGLNNNYKLFDKIDDICERLSVKLSDNEYTTSIPNISPFIITDISNERDSYVATPENTNDRYYRKIPDLEDAEINFKTSKIDNDNVCKITKELMPNIIYDPKEVNKLKNALDNIITVLDAYGTIENIIDLDELSNLTRSLFWEYLNNESFFNLDRDQEMGGFLDRLPMLRLIDRFDYCLWNLSDYYEWKDMKMNIYNFVKILQNELNSLKLVYKIETSLNVYHRGLDVLVYDDTNNILLYVCKMSDDIFIESKESDFEIVEVKEHLEKMYLFMHVLITENIIFYEKMMTLIVDDTINDLRNDLFKNNDSDDNKFNI